MGETIDIDDLTLEEIIRITKEAILDVEPSITRPAALAFRKAVARDARAIIARGQIPDLPSE